MLQARELHWDEAGRNVALVARHVPAPQAGEVLLAHTAVAMALPPSASLRSAAAGGRVLAVGDGVPPHLVGARLGWAGEAAELTTAAPPASHARRPAWRCVPVPDELDDADAALLLRPGLVAEMLCRRVFKVADGHRVLVLGAAGAVGGAVSAWTRQLGALVLGVVRSDQDVEVARANGCHQVFVADGEPLGEAVAATTQQRGVDVAFDGAGGDNATSVLACLRRRGTWVAFGASAGPRPPLAWQSLQRGSWQLAVPQLADYVRTRDELLRAAGAVFTATRAGVLRATIAARMPFDAAPELLAPAIANGGRGVVLVGSQP
ncbi:MAG: zinc-binding dehydrogenase [Planctomycetota bacterium]